MSGEPLALPPVRGLLRLFFRSPLLLYRLGLGGLGLGGLTGKRIMLTTVGRKSGKRRRAAVDIIRHDADSDTYYVISVWGERSDWYRNLLVNPSLRAQVGWRSFTARATPLPDSDAGEMMAEYAHRHPMYTRAILRLIGFKPGPSGDEEALRALGPQMRVVAIQPEPRL
jgi:deazaflavin-dependent oxidoreductase (nitroreductase family)